MTCTVDRAFYHVAQFVEKLVWQLRVALGAYDDWGYRLRVHGVLQACCVLKMVETDSGTGSRHNS